MGVIIFILKKEQAYLTDFLSLAANDLKNKGYERLLLFLLLSSLILPCTSPSIALILSRTIYLYK